MKIDLNKVAREIEVDNRIPLRNYYRIADNLLRQVCSRYRNGVSIQFNSRCRFLIHVKASLGFDKFRNWRM